MTIIAPPMLSIYLKQLKYSVKPLSTFDSVSNSFYSFFNCTSTESDVFDTQLNFNNTIDELNNHIKSATSATELKPLLKARLDELSVNYADKKHTIDQLIEKIDPMFQLIECFEQKKLYWNSENPDTPLIVFLTKIIDHPNYTQTTGALSLLHHLNDAKILTIAPPETLSLELAYLGQVDCDVAYPPNDFTKLDFSDTNCPEAISAQKLLSPAVNSHCPDNFGGKKIFDRANGILQGAIIVAKELYLSPELEATSKTSLAY